MKVIVRDDDPLVNYLVVVESAEVEEDVGTVRIGLLAVTKGAKKTEQYLRDSFEHYSK